MGGALVGMLFLLLVVTIFALSNLGTVTINFLQVAIYTGPLALIVVGAGVLVGAGVRVGGLVGTPGF